MSDVLASLLAGDRPDGAHSDDARTEGTPSDGVPSDTVRWFVPGRIEVLGKHTDYAGGRSLLAAVDTGHTVTATAREDRVLEVRSEVAHGTVTIDLDAGGARPADQADGHWGGYVRTVADRLEKNFPGRLRGADVTVTSTLPLAAGMSSSSALVVGLALALIDLSGIAADPVFTREITTTEQLGEYLGTAENGQSFGSLAGDRGVGTFGGSEDHTAMLCGRPGALVQYSFCPVRHERTIDVDDSLTFVVAVSGVEAAKTGAARDDYNRVSLAVSSILHRWQEATGRDDASLAEAVSSGPGAVRRLRELAADDDYLVGRLEQFLAESERIIPAAALALEEGDLEEFGRLVDESQAGAEDGLRNQVPETIALPRLARTVGAHAASAFGAGFGGSAWALVPADGAEQFAARWLDAYRAEFPGRADATTAITRPGGAARRLAS
ncbi:galactokinase family protein [Brachybacterium alimentarium]|uniref:galactokinase family protein n=1 Tax=Brachybacterium alimentarium TaxID=47845 RepID=UPI001C3EDA33|nr:galactokinase family protein [Brachybacterium alimentarium]